MARHLVALVCVMAWSASLSAAPPDAPDWKKKLSPTEPGEYPSLPAGKLTYNLSWKGLLNSARLEFDIGKPGDHKPGVIVVKSTGKSMGAGGAIFPYQGSGWSELNARTMRPNLTKSSEKKNGKEVQTDNRFFEDKMVFREVTREKKKLNKRQFKETVKTHVFAESPVYDIGSAILFIRSQRLQLGDEISLMMHPYSSPYLLTAKVLAKERRHNTDCIKLSLQLSKIDRKTLKLKPYKKMKKPAILWFSDDPLRLPLEVRSKVFIGDVRATLQGFQKH